MANKVNGHTYYLADDCDTLVCKLENAAYEAFMEREYDRADRLNADLEKLEAAIKRNDRKAMQEILNNYMGMFKRYR